MSHVKLKGAITPSRSEVAERGDFKSEESGFFILNLKYLRARASLAIQWLRFRLPIRGWIEEVEVVEELGSHMPRGQKTRTQTSSIVTN